MQYKAIVSKQYPMADESLRVVIEDTDSFETFKYRVFDILKISDQRSHNHMMWLLEDTNLTDNLEYNELRQIKEAVNLLFPSAGIPTKLDLGANTAFEFSRIMAGGEDVKLFLHDIKSGEELTLALKNIWDVLDNRLKRTNTRDIKFKEYVGKLSFETKMKITTILQLLYGKEIEEVGKVLKEINEGALIKMKEEQELSVGEYNA